MNCICMSDIKLDRIIFHFRGFNQISTGGVKNNAEIVMEIEISDCLMFNVAIALNIESISQLFSFFFSKNNGSVRCRQ